MVDLYFKSEETKLIFTLVETKGATQLSLLGLNYSYYCDREKAKNWYEDIKNKLENIQHPKLDEAMENLKKLYKGMGGIIDN
ncbi:hypothetical protein LDK17_00025 [Fusobacterium polymorphum]|uniref:hypothetical protein n=1 Tax=Fusobacterium nucleatum subsp. polymorphum TaxID=76857 RepID=UPI0030CD6D74